MGALKERPRKKNQREREREGGGDVSIWRGPRTGKKKSEKNEESKSGATIVGERGKESYKSE